MTKIVTWEGPEPAEVRALQRAGGSPIVEPGESREVGDELAESLCASSDDWSLGEQRDEGSRVAWTKAELDEYAAEHEVPDYPNQRAKLAEKVAAIEAFQAAGAAVEEPEPEPAEQEAAE